MEVVDCTMIESANEKILKLHSATKLSFLIIGCLMVFNSLIVRGLQNNFPTQKGSCLIGVGI